MKTISVFLAVSLLVSTPVLAQTTTSTLPERQNGGTRVLEGANGPVTVTWGQDAKLPNAAHYKTTVAELDRNGDGVVSRGEVPAGHALESEFRLVDRNGDGRVNAEELAGWR